MQRGHVPGEERSRVKISLPEHRAPSVRQSCTGHAGAPADRGDSSKAGHFYLDPTEGMQDSRTSILPGAGTPWAELEGEMKDIPEALAMAVIYLVFAASAFIAAVLFHP